MRFTVQPGRHFRVNTTMIYAFLLLFGVGLLAGLLVLYPAIQRRREDEIARRLEGVTDPRLAMIEMDRGLEATRHEAGFFRAVLTAEFWAGLGFWR